MLQRSYMDDDNKNFKIETNYNSIQLVYYRGRLELRSQDKSLQSVVNLDKPHHLELRNLEYLMSVLLFVAAPQRILMLGTAAGSLLHFLRYHYPRADITAVDIDNELIERLLELGILPPADDRLTYICDDAQQFIERSEQSFDLVLVDVFNGAQSPPWLLETASIQQLHDLVSNNGALAFNLLIDSDHDFRLFNRAVRQQFQQQTVCLPVSGLENRIVFGVRNKSAASDMTSNMQTALDLSVQLEIDFMPILSVIYNTNPVGGGLI
jgi:spermidine synthase